MGSWRVAADARTAAGAFTAPKMAAAASSAAPTVSVLRRNWGGEYENVSVLVAIAVNEDG